jgi:hypothetical protein
MRVVISHNGERLVEAMISSSAVAGYQEQGYEVSEVVFVKYKTLFGHKTKRVETLLSPSHRVGSESR